MHAYQITGFGQPLQKIEKATPVPKGSELLLEVEACGVCHSDLHLWDGFFDLGEGKKLPLTAGRTLPLTLGHEIVGRVIAKGDLTVGVAIGDRRAVYPWVGCGACAVCRAGREELCQASTAVIGVHADGGYASHVLVPHAKYLFAVDGLTPEFAATIGCSGLTAYSALKTAGRLEPDQPLLIAGAGGVGLQAVRLAKVVTGQAPIVADIDAKKREAALAQGASAAIDPAADGALKALLKSTGGVAAAIDFAGVPASANFAIGALRKGGRMVLVGLMGGSIALALPMIVLRAITISGSYVGTLADMAELIALLRRLELPDLPVHALALDSANAALASLQKGEVLGRIVLEPTLRA
jgi:D-arabinose 1-dehydrogenase-like Zn-dependent alcohol dehydrogenase